MNKDKVVGISLIGGAILVSIMIIYLLFLAGDAVALLTMKIIVTLAIIAIAGIAGWIGYTLATTPPPKPIEEIEKEIEEELKKLEQESKQAETKQ